MTRNQISAVAVLWVLCTAITAHLLYSSLGFNPTDDGFTLAYSRRLLDGQVPHRDFIIIRPALSPLLHVPEILLGGPYTFWLSRFVFFVQCACVAWFGTAFVCRGLGLALITGHQCAFALLSFVFCCHYFPPMAWHTIDGLFLAVVGFHVRSLSSTRSASIGYFLMGSAYLCKQSFIFVAPVVLLLFGDWKNWRYLFASLLPAGFYAAFMAVTGGVSDSAHQLLSQTGIAEVGVYSYLNGRTALGLVAGIATTGLLGIRPVEEQPCSGIIRSVTGLALIGAALVLATKSLASGELRSSSFALFGMVCGSVIGTIAERGQRPVFLARTGLVVALLGWSCSLSVGYNSPVLASGIFMTFLLAISYRSLCNVGRRSPTLLMLIAVVLAIPAFHHTRTHHIYRERPASELTASLGNVLSGGRLIRTNPNTHAFLSDLNSAIDMVTGKGFQYAIIPDCAAHWVKSAQRNPLPVDWAQSVELNTEALLNRVIRSIEKQGYNQMLIVQKVRASGLPSGFARIAGRDLAYYAVVAYVRAHLDKVGETEYFDIYRHPPGNHAEGDR